MLHVRLRSLVSPAFPPSFADMESAFSLVGLYVGDTFPFSSMQPFPGWADGDPSRGDERSRHLFRQRARLIAEGTLELALEGGENPVERSSIPCSYDRLEAAASYDACRSTVSNPAGVRLSEVETAEEAGEVLVRADATERLTKRQRQPQHSLLHSSEADCPAADKVLTGGSVVPRGGGKNKDTSPPPLPAAANEVVRPRDCKENPSTGSRTLEACHAATCRERTNVSPERFISNKHCTSKGIGSTSFRTCASGAGTKSQDEVKYDTGSRQTVKSSLRPCATESDESKAEGRIDPNIDPKDIPVRSAKQAAMMIDVSGDMNSKSACDVSHTRAQVHPSAADSANVSEGEHRHDKGKGGNARCFIGEERRKIRARSSVGSSGRQEQPAFVVLGMVGENADRVVLLPTAPRRTETVGRSPAHSGMTEARASENPTKGQFLRRKTCR